MIFLQSRRSYIWYLSPYTQSQSSRQGPMSTMEIHICPILGAAQANHCPHSSSLFEPHRYTDYIMLLTSSLWSAHTLLRRSYAFTRYDYASTLSSIKALRWLDLRNTALYVSTRAAFIWAQNYMPKRIANTVGRTNNGNTPLTAILFCSVLGFLSLVGLSKDEYSQVR